MLIKLNSYKLVTFLPVVEGITCIPIKFKIFKSQLRFAIKRVCHCQFTEQSPYCASVTFGEVGFASQ